MARSAKGDPVFCRIVSKKRRNERGVGGHNRKASEGVTIKVVIECQEADSILEGVSADQEIGKDVARAGVTLLSSSSNRKLERFRRMGRE